MFLLGVNIYKAIRFMKDKCSSGPDGISAYLVEKFAAEICFLQCSCFNCPSRLVSYLISGEKPLSLQFIGKVHILK